MTSVSDPYAPPRSASEEIRSGWSLERKPEGGRRRRQPAAHEPLSHERVAIISGLLVVALLASWFVLYAVFFSGLQESHDQHVLYTQLRTALAGDNTPFGGSIKAGTPVAVISSPALGLTRTVIVEGTSSKDLTQGPGHYPSSPFPGQAGSSRIYGRSATFGSPFGKLHSLKAGDPITITTGQGVFGYTVVDVRGPKQLQPSLAQLGNSWITLVSSTGSGWRGGWAPTHAIYADAKLTKGTIVATPSGAPTTVAANEKTLAGDTSDLVPLVLWLQALVLLTAGLVYSFGRWSMWQLWLVGTPALIAVLWGASSSAMILLPNLA